MKILMRYLINYNLIDGYLINSYLNDWTSIWLLWTFNQTLQDVLSPSTQNWIGLWQAGILSI